MKKMLVVLLLAALAAAFAACGPRYQRDLGNGLTFHAGSGVFRDGELVYSTCPSWRDGTYFSSDGMFILNFLGSWWPDNQYTSSPTIRFYEQGELMLTHNVLDLLWHGEQSIVLTPGNLFAAGPWDFPELRYHDREADTLHVVTVEWREVLFCLQTGEILSMAEEPLPVAERVLPANPAATFPWHIVIVATAAVLLSATVLVIILRRRKNQLRITNYEL